MKKTNKLFLLAILFIALTVPVVQSCKKYPDGPMFSLQSRKERVANTWKIENYKKNGNDLTSSMSGYTETYTKNGNYSYTWYFFGGSGTWAFQNHDKEIRITGNTGLSSQTLYILRLEEKSFWYYYMDGSDKKEFHMIPN